MSQQIINIGTVPNDRTGDTWRDAMIKVNDNETELFNSFADNIIVVNSEADFPAPSGGVITLADNTAYFLGAPIVTANRFVSGSNSHMGSTSFLQNQLEYTGSGTMFTSIDVSFTMFNMRISCPSGTVFNAVHTTPGIHQINVDSVIIEDCVSLGTSGNALAVIFRNSSQLAGNDGISLSGTNTLIDFSQWAQVTTAGSGFIGIDAYF